jgi:hypothetical protein
VIGFVRVCFILSSILQIALKASHSRLLRLHEIPTGIISRLLKERASVTMLDFATTTIFLLLNSYCILVYRLWQSCDTVSSLKRLI